MRSIAAITCLGMLFAACGSSDPYQTVDPALREQIRTEKERQAESNKRIHDFNRVLIDLDKAIDKLSQAYNNSGNKNADNLQEKLLKILQQQSTEHFDSLLNSAVNAEIPRNQAIALAALGFSDRAEALDPMLNGLLSSNEEVVNNATVGLAMLQNPNTPPRALQRVFLNESFDDDTRITAAWALYRTQLKKTTPTQFIEVWRETLDKPIETYSAGILINALRGLGLARDPALARFAEPYVAHTTPKVRESCCVALGRLGNRASNAALITLITPAESNQNVRLAAHIALRGLAGGEDRGYNVKEWTKVFEDK